MGELEEGGGEALGWGIEEGLTPASGRGDGAGGGLGGGAEVSASPVKKADNELVNIPVIVPLAANKL